ncbi:MAG: DUF2793 domain-containing protein [bacterium]|nr:DUF2793 domain-containing protein [bacterium]
MSTTPVFGITLGEEGQANGWTTANELFRMLELFGGTLQFIEFERVAEPTVGISEGDTYWTDASCTGTNWSTHGNEIATYLNGAWTFYDPTSTGLDVDGIWAFDVANDVPLVFSSVTDTWRAVATEQSVAFVRANPTLGLTATAFFTNKAITITEIRAARTGGTDIDWTLYHDTTAQGTGNTIIARTSTASGSGDDLTSFTDATVPADSFVTYVQGTTGGSPTEIALQIFYTEDA